MYKKVLLRFCFVCIVVNILILFYPRDFEKIIPSRFNIDHCNKSTIEKNVENKHYTKELSSNEIRIIINYFNSLKYISFYHIKKNKVKDVESYSISIKNSNNNKDVFIRTIGNENIAIMYNGNIKFYNILKSNIDLDFLNNFFMQ